MPRFQPSTYEHQWNLTDAPDINGLNIHIAGRVVVSLDPEQSVAATVVAIATSTSMLSAVDVQVVPEWTLTIAHGVRTSTTTRTLHLSFGTLRSFTNGCDRDGGTLLVYISVRQPVSEVSTTAETIFLDGAFGRHSTTNTLQTYDRDVWVSSPATPLNVSDLTIAMNGRGFLYVDIGGLVVANAFDVHVMDRGSLNMRVGGAIQADSVEITTAGPGSVVIQATIEASHVKSSVLSTGSVTLFPLGYCNDHQVYLAGTGSVFAGSVACAVVRVEAIGRGAAVVQAMEALDRVGTGSSIVKFFNTTPKVILPPATGRFHPHYDRIVRATTNKRRPLQLKKLPPLNKGLRPKDWEVGDDVFWWQPAYEAMGLAKAALATVPTTPTHGLLWLEIGAVCGLIVLVVFKFVGRRRLYATIR